MGILIPSEGGGSASFDFIQSTAPTITADGQVWLKPTDGSHPGTAGVWLSRVITTSPFVAYWVTSVAYESGVLGGATVSATVYIPTNSPGTSAYSTNAVVGSNGVAPMRFYDYIHLQVRPAAGTFDGTNFWTFELMTTTVIGANSIGDIASYVLNTGTFDGNTTISFLAENVVTPSIGNRVAHTLRAIRSGAPVNITSTVTGFKWRNIHP